MYSTYSSSSVHSTVVAVSTLLYCTVLYSSSSVPSSVVVWTQVLRVRADGLVRAGPRSGVHKLLAEICIHRLITREHTFGILEYLYSVQGAELGKENHVNTSILC